jgi:hypothetical protein
MISTEFGVTDRIEFFEHDVLINFMSQCGKRKKAKLISTYKFEDLCSFTMILVWSSLMQSLQGISYFSEMDWPRKLTVKLKSKVGARWEDTEGVYKLSSNPVNGKAHWLQEAGSNALWFDKVFQNWKIGLVSGLGGSTCKVLTHRNTARHQPHKAVPWIYYVKDGRWIGAEDIIVEEES